MWEWIGVLQYSIRSLHHNFTSTESIFDSKFRHKILCRFFTQLGTVWPLVISHLFLAINQPVDSINRGSIVFFECRKALFYYGNCGHCSAQYLVSTIWRNFVILFGDFFGIVVVYVEESWFLYCVEFVLCKKTHFFHIVCQVLRFKYVWQRPEQLYIKASSSGLGWRLLPCAYVLCAWLQNC